MPPTSVSALNVLFFLLPGFISFSVERAMFFRPDDTTFDKTVSVLIHTFIVNVIYGLISYLTSLDYAPFQAYTNGDAVTLTITNPCSLVSLFLTTIVWGLIFGWLKNNDLLLWIPRLVKMTKRTTRSSVWQDVFTDMDTYVLVLLKDGRGVSGWPQYFENKFTDGPVVFLTKAQWIIEGEEPKAISDPGILINGSEIAVIQFYSKKGEENVN